MDASAAARPEPSDKTATFSDPVSTDQLNLEDQRPKKIDGQGEGGEDVRRDLRAVSSTPASAPAPAPAVARLNAEADRDAGLALRAIALRLPEDSQRRRELLEDAEDHLARARFGGVHVPAAEQARRRVV